MQKIAMVLAICVLSFVVSAMTLALAAKEIPLGLLSKVESAKTNKNHKRIAQHKSLGLVPPPPPTAVSSNRYIGSFFVLVELLPECLWQR